jgi:hypothetical protein
MAGEIEVEYASPEYDEFAKLLRAKLGDGDLATNIFNKHMTTAIKKAAKHVEKVLKANTPKGPTGNLKRAIATRVIPYKNNRNWFSATGYSSSGHNSNKIPDVGERRRGRFLGYHQYWVEFGTKRRRTRQSRVAVSHDNASRPSGGGHLIIRNTKGGAVRTTPKPPKGFFKSAPKGSKVELGSFKASHPIKKTSAQASGAMAAAVNENASQQIEKAWKEFSYKLEKGNRR